jgi:hypothetical protein
MSNLDDKQAVLKVVDDAECVQDEKGKFYIREKAEHHEMSGHFKTEAPAWKDAREYCREFLDGE